MLITLCYSVLTWIQSRQRSEVADALARLAHEGSLLALTKEATEGGLGRKARSRRLLWEDEKTYALALFPTQIVDLHSWTALADVGLQPEGSSLVIVQAEPGATKRDEYRRFSTYGQLVAWKCEAQLALLLQSDLLQLVDLMHIFRLGNIILDGGWRVIRIITVNCEGRIGTLIGVRISEKLGSLCPADLRRLSAGVFPKGVQGTLSSESSRHEISTIKEESPPDDEPQELPNWHERSPRRPTITSPPLVETKAVSGPRRRLSSFCSGTLSVKSSSLASLLLCTSKSMEVDEGGLDAKLLSPDKARSLCASPKRGKISLTPRKSPNRFGKPPNILVLCEDGGRRAQIASAIKAVVGAERYAIYDIRWEQLGVGGWAEATALLVVSGRVTDPGPLLQFLGDGGKLLGWCCEGLPFGPDCKNRGEPGAAKKLIVGDVETGPLLLGSTWSSGDSLPTDFPRIVSTTDSEGISRPLAASVLGRVKETKEATVILLDGGALGGKAVLSQVHLEEGDEESGRVLLSSVLGKHLGIECHQIKAPEFRPASLLGDHKRVLDFLTKVPKTLEQSRLSLTFLSLGEKCGKATIESLPILPLQCPANFSTVKYFENLKTENLGRLIIYADVMASTMNAVNGHFLSHGIVVMAGRQTFGKGRGKNVWLSPEGSACFSLQLKLSLDSEIGRRLSLLQHLAALAVVLAVPEADLRVKWPNDVYGKEEKVGGILVESLVEGKQVIIAIGIGINVANEFPSASISSLTGKKFLPEEFVALVLNELEVLLSNVGKGKWEEAVALYTSHWLHNYSEEETLSVEVSAGNFAECRISGIDEFGFLRVEEVSSGSIFSVRPDGNSFDIANRLIAIKD